MGMSVLNALFSFIGGLGMFLFGMHIMSEGLQKSAGEKSRRFMRLFTDNRLLGVAVGALITAIAQSSSLTTVMAVGFVNAGMMTLSQAVGIIMGANIGTTLTAWLVSMNEWGNLLRPQFFAPLLLGIGVALLLSGKEPRRRDGGKHPGHFGLLLSDWKHECCRSCLQRFAFLYRGVYRDRHASASGHRGRLRRDGPASELIRFTWHFTNPGNEWYSYMEQCGLYRAGTCVSLSEHV